MSKGLTPYQRYFIETMINDKKKPKGESIMVDSGWRWLVACAFVVMCGIALSVTYESLGVADRLGEDTYGKAATLWFPYAWGLFCAIPIGMIFKR